MRCATPFLYIDSWWGSTAERLTSLEDASTDIDLSQRVFHGESRSTRKAGGQHLDVFVGSCWVKVPRKNHNRYWIPQGFVFGNGGAKLGTPKTNSKLLFSVRTPTVWRFGGSSIPETHDPSWRLSKALHQDTRVKGFAFTGPLLEAGPRIPRQLRTLLAGSWSHVKTTMKFNEVSFRKLLFFFSKSLQLPSVYDLFDEGWFFQTWDEDLATPIGPKNLQVPRCLRILTSLAKIFWSYVHSLYTKKCCLKAVRSPLCLESALQIFVTQHQPHRQDDISKGHWNTEPFWHPYLDPYLSH